MLEISLSGRCLPGILAFALQIIIQSLVHCINVGPGKLSSKFKSLEGVT